MADVARVWKPKYNKILIYAEQGMPVPEIAEKVKMHPRTIYTIMARDDFRDKRAQVDGDALKSAREKFISRAVEAAEKIIEIARKGKPDQRLQLDAAKEILYQVGMKPVEVIETRKREYTPEEILAASKAARELERITDRLGRRESQFLLPDEEENPILAPVHHEVVPEKTQDA